MGLPIEKFIATTNINDIVPEYLRSKVFNPRDSKQTISNAMDVGNPSNFTRLLDLFDNNFEALSNTIEGYSFTDEETRSAMRHVLASSEYLMDPHGAVGYLGLKKYLIDKNSDAVGIFLETAHPAKFKEVVDETIRQSIEIPPVLKAFMQRQKKSIRMKSDFASFKDYLKESL